MIHNPTIARAAPVNLGHDQDVLEKLRRHQRDLLVLMQDLNRTIEAVEVARFSTQPPADGSISAIIAQRAAKAGYAVSLILGRRRAAEIDCVRQAIMAEAHGKGFSLSEIGRAMGGRDHSTVAHGVRAHKQRMGAA